MAAALAVIGVGLFAWPFTVDDAFVVSRYAQRLCGGLGWTFIDGPPTDGITGPLWMLPAAFGELTGIGAPTFQKAFGLAAAATGAWWLARHTPPFAALVLASQSTLGIWGGAGLETGGAVLATSVAVVGYAGRERRDAIAMGVALGLAGWLRPELAPFALLLLIAKRSRVAWIGALVPAVLLVGFRLALFESVFPLPMFAKAGDAGAGAQYVFYGLMFLTGGVGVGVAALAWRTGGDARGLVLACLVHLATVALAGGDWMPGWRLFAPLLPAYAWLVARGVRALPASPALRFVFCAWVVCAGIGDAWLQLPHVRDAGEARSDALALRAQVRGLRSVALVDIGYFTWDSDVRVLDLGGITEPVVAHAPGGHLDKDVPIGWLAEEAPEVILLHSAVPPTVDSEGRLTRLAGYPVERRLAASAYVRRHYVYRETIRYTDGYHYVWLDRRDSPR